MKRKIALLLAFTLILSVLPMSVAANPGGQWAAGQRTGMRVQPNPATNVRHQLRGTLVGRTEAIQAWFQTAGTFHYGYGYDRQAAGHSGGHARNEANFVWAPGGPSTHIYASADYFIHHTALTAPPIRMNLNNAWWMAHSVPTNLWTPSVEVNPISTWTVAAAPVAAARVLSADEFAGF